MNVQARALRGDLAERLGQRELARADRGWLATVAVLADTDVAFERLSGARLNKSERAERAASLAERGLVRSVERELALSKKAPGTPPSLVLQGRRGAQREPDAAAYGGRDRPHNAGLIVFGADADRLRTLRPASQELDKRGDP